MTASLAVPCGKCTGRERFDALLPVLQDALFRRAQSCAELTYAALLDMTHLDLDDDEIMDSAARSGVLPRRAGLFCEDDEDDEDDDAFAYSQNAVPTLAEVRLGGSSR